MPRGRPSLFTQQKIETVLIKYSERIILNKNNVLTVALESDPKWEEINKKDFNGKFQNKSLHIMVTSNRNNLLTKLKGIDFQSNNDTLINSSGSSYNDDTCNSSVDSSVFNEKCVKFQSVITQEKFSEITYSVNYAENTRQGKRLKRNYLKFRPGIWEPFFDEIIYNNTRLPCAFKYKNHHLTVSGSSGNFEGTSVIFYLIVFIIQIVSNDKN